MDLQELINSVIRDTAGGGHAPGSLQLFAPELVLCATIVLILLLRIPRITAWIDSFYVTLAGAAVALWLVAPWKHLDQVASQPPQEFFTGMLIHDPFAIYFRGVLLLFVVLLTIFTRISRVPDRTAAPDFYALVLGSTLGMCLMASANHLIIVFLGVEMASVPSYVLAGMLRGNRRSSEASLKYAVYGAGAAGVMLYGISLLAGVLGSVHMPTMAVRLSEMIHPSAGGAAIGAEEQMVLVLGGLMIMVGLSFKLSAVPFHFWCPDVFEGATAEVDAFLSVASKAAALALLVRVAVGLGHVPAAEPGPAPTAVASMAAGSAANVAHAGQTLDATAPAPIAKKTVLDVPLRTDEKQALVQAAAVSHVDPMNHVREFMGMLLAFVSVITCTFGNLAAYGQTNIKRLLAYSTIAHAGYMIMPVAAAMFLAGRDPVGAQSALAALAVYVAVYLFMNLGAFAVVAFLRNAIGSEEIADYAGLVRSAPVVAVCFSLMLVSLIGIPPLAGFTGKFLVFAALMDAKLITVLVIAGLNTALSLFYYLRVIKVMTMDPEPANRVPSGLGMIPVTFVVALTLPIAVYGLWWDSLSRWATLAASHLLS